MALYSRSARLTLPLASIVEEFKLTKVRALMTLRESRDPEVKETNVVIYTGRNWSVSKALYAAEGQRLSSASMERRGGEGIEHSIGFQSCSS